MRRDYNPHSEEHSQLAERMLERSTSASAYSDRSRLDLDDWETAPSGELVDSAGQPWDVATPEGARTPLSIDIYRGDEAYGDDDGSVLTLESPPPAPPAPPDKKFPTRRSKSPSSAPRLAGTSARTGSRGWQPSRSLPLCSALSTRT